ncbi:DUF389 domain-containing protein [Candidatus Gracilibacteria bacterium]|nr:DUF389 domain-containing protein [Candidatus Gracilibacteria bacterium]
MSLQKSGFHGIEFLLESLRRWRAQIHENKIVNQAVQNLISNSRLKPQFFVMAILAGGMATVGIILNDVVILIAAMVLAPLLHPLISCAAGIVLGHGRLVLYALKSFLGGTIAVALFTATLVNILLFLDYDFQVSHFLDRFAGEQTAFLLLLSAFLSGFAGVYSWLRSTNNANLVGIAIAVSIIPLVSFLGVLLGLKKWMTLLYFSGWLGLNLSSLIFGAITAFIILGFRQPKSKISREIDNERITEGT